MYEIYVIVWSGGYEAPQYAVREIEADALQLAEDWVKSASETDWIEILRIDLALQMQHSILKRKRVIVSE